MNKIIELYGNGEHSLVITTLAAGRIGASDERFNSNRVSVFKSLGIVPEEVYSAVQHHTKTVIDAGDWQSEPQSEADGIISANRDDVLGVTVADCMPIYLFNKEKGVRALLHSGWKGTGIAIEALKMMKEEYGCMAEDTVAVLGPAIGSCCYNVDQERAAIFSNLWGKNSVVERADGPYLSLKSANVGMLEKAGVHEIIDRSYCTCCSDLYGSFRREGAGNFTQMMAISYLNEGH